MISRLLPFALVLSLISSTLLAVDGSGESSGTVIWRVDQRTLPVGVPLSGSPVDAGFVNSVATSEFTSAGKKWATNAFAGVQKYAVRFTSGLQSGRETLIIGNSENQIRFASGDLSLIASKSAVVKGDRFEIFAVRTLGDILGTTPQTLKLVGATSSSAADTVSLFVNGVEKTLFFHTGLQKWVDSTDTSADFTELPIFSTDGIKITRRSGKVTLLATGSVPKTRAFPTLSVGKTKLFAYPFPVTVPLSQLNFGGPGAWARGSNTDQIQLLESNVWVPYFQTAALAWRKITAPGEDQSGKALPLSTSFLVINGGTGQLDTFSLELPYKSSLAPLPAATGGKLKPLAFGLDDDQDGYSDIWEAAYGYNLNPQDDLDGDGMNAADESRAGTVPNDPKSVLRFLSLIIKPDESGLPAVAEMEWKSVAGKKYNVEVSHDLKIWSAVNASVIGNGSARRLTLDLQTTFSGGGAILRRYTDLTNVWNMDIFRELIAAEEADETRVLEALDIPQSSPDESNFGHYIRGWIVPERNGNYVFWIAGDDQCELWLSTTSNEENKRLIASVPGFTSYQEWNKYSAQRSRAFELKAGKPYFFEVYNREGGGLDHVSVAWKGPGIAGDREIIAGRHLAGAAESVADNAAIFGSVFFRLLPSDIDSDGDGVSDYEERALGFNYLTATTIPRLNDIESIRRSLLEENTLSVGAPVNRAYEAGREEARFTVFRTGNVTPLTVRYTMSGTAKTGIDYVPVSGTVELPIGAASASISIKPIIDSLVEPAETVVLTLTPDSSYKISTPSFATVSIDDAKDQIFVARLRPLAGARSNGWGTATLNIAGNALFSSAGVSLGGLSGAQVSTEFYISTNGETGNAVFTLPAGQIASQRWEFPPAEGFTQEEIIQALENGRLWARVKSGKFPSGEVFGRFAYEKANFKMPIPPKPPKLPTGKPNAASAARFLTQASFGPNTEEIAKLQDLGYENYLDRQLSAKPTFHLPYVRHRRQELQDEGRGDGWQRPRQEAWWQVSLTANDQLRQRVAFALSQIFVVSDIGVLDGSHTGLTNYYDMLLKNAFGNYRDLLQDVTLSPIMGQYLSMVRNQKPNPETGSEPDENYAREIMQLFSIGLNQLHLDGSLKLGPTGMPIPTYTQEDIVGLAHVFTGWGYYFPKGTRRPDFRYGEREEFHSMVQYPEYHDRNKKTIVTGKQIKPGQRGEAELKIALDTLFRHPNTGPFICRQLIQRLVTSNPSPGYIHRVSSVFNNNGKGVRGDLKAVVRAILMDYEARSGDFYPNIGYGKLKEPVLRISQALRASGAQPPLPYDKRKRFFLDLQYDLPQAPLKSPSVFNFFQPGYIYPGKIAAAGLFSPEFQISSEPTVIDQINANHRMIFYGFWTGEQNKSDRFVNVYLNVNKEVSILKEKGVPFKTRQEKLLNHLSLRYLQGRMSDGLRQQILEAFAELPEWFDLSDPRLGDRARMAVYLVLASPEYAVQR